MYNLLNELRNNKILVSVYTDMNNDEYFAVGYIIALTEKDVLMLNIGLYGEFDGYSVIKIVDIYRIEKESKYINKIRKLCNINFNEIFKIDITDDLLMDLLNAAIYRHSIVIFSINNNDNTIMGYVDKVKDNCIYVLQIDEYGEDDGYTIFSCDIIFKAVMEDTEGVKVDRLYKKNINNN